MRQFNERVVLQALRLHGSLPKADLARLTGLSAQTIGLITARLEEDQLIVKQSRVRGRIGQPSVPLALNPDGAFSIGIKVGRRGCEWLLIDFTAQRARAPRHALRLPRAGTICCRRWPSRSSACAMASAAWPEGPQAWAWPRRSSSAAGIARSGFRRRNPMPGTTWT
jgi:hypothetical protein